MKLSRLFPLLPCFALIALLPRSAGAAAFDCSKAKTPVETSICSDADLSKADDVLSDRFNAVLAASNDKESVRAGERAWLRFRDQACAAGSYKSHQEDIVVCLKNAVRLRTEFLGPDDVGNRVAPPEPVRVPLRWWGTDIDALMKSRYFGGKQASFSVLSIGTGLNGNLIAEIAVDRKGVEKRLPGDTLALDLFSGVIVGSGLDDSALANLAAKPGSWLRHGVTPHSILSFEVTLDSGDSVRSQTSNCDEPFNASLGIYRNGEARREVYLVKPRRISRKIIRTWDTPHCAIDSKDAEIWTLDFDTLAQFPVLKMPDNSVVVLATTYSDEGHRDFIVRYSQNLESSFFNGRGDFLLLDSEAVVDLPDDASAPNAARGANSAAFASARTNQLAKTAQ